MVGGSAFCRPESLTCQSDATLYASERKARRSEVVLTGANRARGTTIAPALSKHSIAAPIAVSSWKTIGERGSRGSTVLEFLINGNGIKPPCFSISAFKRSSRIHNEFVLKKL